MSDGPADWLQQLGGAAAGGLAGLGSAALAFWTGRRVNRATARKIAAEADKLAAESEKAGVDAEAALVDALNRRIDMLIRGYEQQIELLIKGYDKRIEDLTGEIATLRAEIINLRQALDKRPKPPAEPIGI